MILLQILLAYLLAINLVTFFIYGHDKHKARKGTWRVPEHTLLLLALFGGALGAWIGMKVFRHKTKHWKFRILVPLLLILWLAFIVFLMQHTEASNSHLPGYLVNILNFLKEIR